MAIVKALKSGINRNHFKNVNLYNNNNNNKSSDQSRLIVCLDAVK